MHGEETNKLVLKKSLFWYLCDGFFLHVLLLFFLDRIGGKEMIFTMDMILLLGLAPFLGTTN